jgi:DNA-binding NarL/FixJ family response regulator
VLVEDHPVLRRRFAGQLVDAGMDVVAAVGTSAAGWAAVRSLDPAVAVIDSRLPDGRGVDLCRTVRRDLPHVALLLHARLISSVEQQEALDAGVAAVVPKGIRGHDLVSAVRTQQPRQNSPQNRR